MALGWLIKAVPWGQVIEATPTIVRNARGLWQKAQVEQQGGRFADLDDAELGDRLALAERDIAELERRLTDSAELIKSLAEQNAALVETVEALKSRQRVLFGACAALAAAIAALALWPLAS
jgi:uncharacterized coiled-coil protein SlyX